MRYLKALPQEKLYAHRGKCSFGKGSVTFLSHSISKNGLSVDQRKTTAIEQMKSPSTRKERMSLLGLSGHYRRFIFPFAQIELPLMKLVEKEVRWEWSHDQDKAVRDLKVALQQAPVLQLPNFAIPFAINTGASGCCMGGVLSQITNGEDHPIAFYYKNFGVHEQACPAHEQEILAINTALSKWSHYLHGRSFGVFTDNTACLWMLHHPMVTPKLARMLTFFSQFNFMLHRVNGTSNVVADALSRSNGVTPSTDPLLASIPLVYDCEPQCVVRDTALRRHSLHSTAL